MKKLLTILALLIGAFVHAQTAGDVKTFKKAAGVGDVATYTTPVNSSLFALNSSGNFTLLAQSTFSLAAHTHTFASLTSKPTTVGGYGIMDFNSLGDARWSLLGHTHTASQVTDFNTAGDARWSLLAHVHTFASLASKPTTLSGYGITDAQPIDGDLTDIAALTTTSYGRSFLTLADAAAARTYIGAGTGSGSVTTVSVTTANGVSGSVANATTTPAISLTLGAITPATVNGVTLSGSSSPTLAVTGTSTISGTHSGSHSGTSSGTNTGDQTSIVGITGTLAQFNTALTSADFATGGGTITGTSSGTNTGDQNLSTYVVGPASATNNAFVMYDGTTGKLIKNGLVGSSGGNGVADAGKPVIFEAGGSLKVTASTYGLQATCGSGQVGISGQAADDGTASEGYSDTGWGGYWYSNSNIGSVGHSIAGIGAWGVSQDSTGVYASSGFKTPLYVKASNPSHEPDIAWFVNTDDEGVYIENDGGLEWTTPTGAATTRTELGLGNVENTALSTWPGSTNITTLGTIATGVWNGSAVPLTNGGTGAASALGARSNLGLGSMATQDANSVTITGGSVTGITDLTVADGGTGSSTAAGARTNLGTAPLDATYITQTANSELSGEQALGSLATGILKNTTTTGVLSIAAAGDFPTLNQNTSGNAATVTTNANLTGPITSVGNATTVADGELASIAGLTSAPDKVPQFTGSGTAALVDLKLGTATAYGGTITWTAGAAPSGTANLTQYYTRVGNLVTWHIDLTYANAGTTVTNFTLTFPTEFPTPAIPTGFTGANVWIWDCFGTKILSTPSGTIAGANLAAIRRNAADNGFEIQHSAFTSGTYRTFLLSGTYFTQ